MNTSEIPVYVGAAIIAIAGAVGGGVNSALIHLRWVQAAPHLSVGGKSVRLTYAINIITGVAAALFSWGMYGPAGTEGILGKMSDKLLSISSVFGAGLIGYSGSSWLTTHADKQEWKKNTQDAMTIPADQSADELSQQIAKLGPVEASRKIRDLHG
jgi:hypothetical protein